MANHYALLQSVYFKLPPTEVPGEAGALANPPVQSIIPAIQRLGALCKMGVMGADIALLLLRFSKLILNPNDISPIFKGSSFLKHKSFQLSLQTFYEDPETAELLRTRYLSEAPYDLDVLLQLPPDTLGHAFASHMRSNQLEVVFYPPLEKTDDDDIAYLRRRARQTHDIHHVVLGYPAIDVGEMAISAFYLSQHRVPLSALLIGFGFLYTILREPQRIEELIKAIETGWQAGQQARRLLGIRWEEYWETPLETLRQELRIPLPPPIFTQGAKS
ncbi:MAG: hypothetical protein IGS03_11035 [Candidatus Sericytochromatia bacterium]|nr:hypothetical protein [Candidatus Sericytochromatia bacterium]